MFKDIKNSKLRLYFVDALIKYVIILKFKQKQKTLEFNIISNMAFLICFETDEDKKLNFLFDVFSFYSDSIKK